MTKLRETSVAVVIALVLPRQANAQQLLTGNDLYKQCQSSPATPAYGQCVGYIQGVTDTMAGEADLARIKQGKTLYQGFYSHYWCIPPVGSQINDLVIKYLRDHPADRNSGAYGLVSIALTQAWPCQSPTDR
jgi:hypothetical protein